MLDRRAVELVLISLLAAFCSGLAWALDHELFAVAFAAAAVSITGPGAAARVNPAPRPRTEAAPDQATWRIRKPNACNARAHNSSGSRSPLRATSMIRLAMICLTKSGCPLS